MRLSDDFDRRNEGVKRTDDGVHEASDDLTLWTRLLSQGKEQATITVTRRTSRGRGRGRMSGDTRVWHF